MAVSDDQYNRLLERINKIEEALNDAITILNKTTTASTISKVVTVFETEFDDIKDRLTNVETRVENIESDPYSEIE